MADEEAMMAEWEAMAEEGASEDDAQPPDRAGGSTRVADQSEIDSLLGVTSAGSEEGDESGITANLHPALVAYERLPVLAGAFAPPARLMSTSLRPLDQTGVLWGKRGGGRGDLGGGSINKKN